MQTFFALSASAQPELKLVLPRGDPQKPVKSLSQGALIAETDRNSDICDELVFVLQRVTSGLNA